MRFKVGCVGLPAVAFDVGGISDWLTYGQSGELAAAQPPTALGLGTALAAVVSDHDRYNRLRYNAWKTSQRLNAELHLRHLIRVLEVIRVSKSLR